VLERFHPQFLIISESKNKVERMKIKIHPVKPPSLQMAIQQSIFMKFSLIWSSNYMAKRMTSSYPPDLNHDTHEDNEIYILWGRLKCSLARAQGLHRQIVLPSFFNLLFGLMNNYPFISPQQNQKDSIYVPLWLIMASLRTEINKSKGITHKFEVENKTNSLKIK